MKVNLGCDDYVFDACSLNQQHPDLFDFKQIPNNGEEYVVKAAKAIFQ